MNFYKLDFLLEGLAEDFIVKNPDLKVAYDKGIKNIGLLTWLNSVKNQEPIEDIVPVILSFNNNKQRLKEKDINAYKTVANLRQILENLGGSKTKQEKTLKSEETTKIGEFGDWIVVMPHTRESSCLWGKGTSWCTAATASGNLFLSYTGRKQRSIFLYYLIKKGADSVKDPDSKISIGINNKVMIMDGMDGGLTVNATNTGMTEEKLKSVLGSNYSQIINAIKQHNNTIEKHPALDQIEKIASSKNPEDLEKFLRGMSEYEASDFIENLMDHNLSPELFLYVIKRKSVGDRRFSGINKEDIAILLKNENLLLSILEKNLSDDDVYAILDSLYSNTGLALVDPENIILNVAKHKKELTPRNVYDILHYANIADNSHSLYLDLIKILGKENLIKLRDYPDEKFVLMDIVYTLLLVAPNKKETADILGKKNINKLISGRVLDLLHYDSDKNTMAEILGQENINKLSDGEIRRFINYYNDKDEILNIIIDYKKELTSDNILWLLQNSSDKENLARKIRKDIDKLSGYEIFISIMSIPPDQTAEMVNLLGKENFDKMNQEQKKIVNSVL
jgi:hypothetical protein